MRSGDVSQDGSDQERKMAYEQRVARRERSEHKRQAVTGDLCAASVAQWLVLSFSERKVVGSNPPTVVHTPCRSPRLMDMIYGRKFPAHQSQETNLTRRFVRYAADFISCKREHRRHETQL